nr:hypothetical protein [Kofleriaceae bacterium]
MSLFGHKAHAILTHAKHCAILGAEAEGGQLTRLCYTGHASGLSTKGAVQAIGPGGSLLWHAEFANEDDLSEGHVAVHDGVVVSRVKHGSGHELQGRELWTGAIRWKLDVPKMVTRMGIEGSDSLIFVTLDHAVHDVSIASGDDRLRSPVMTDQAARSLIDHTRHPVQPFSSGSGSGGHADWSRVYRPLSGLEVYERDWAGSHELGVGWNGNADILGQGRYDGALTVGAVTVLGFELEVGGETRYHWYLYQANPKLLLAILRDDGASTLHRDGQPAWTGKL